MCRFIVLYIFASAPVFWVFVSHAYCFVALIILLFLNLFLSIDFYIYFFWGGGVFLVSLYKN